ncbi:unnamed protein product [Auanema sp. JU1783]|nr:unnamed protein product [Auanema sp. JU1783]
MSGNTISTGGSVGAGRDIRIIHMSQRYHQGSRKNMLDQGDKTWPTVEKFVESQVRDISKRRVIKKILVSTNGIAAVKCIWSMRSFLMQHFRQDHIIKFICLTTEQEIASNAEYLKMADHIVIAPAGDNKNNYANVDEIVSHAVSEKVDAVWAGWGHASENPELPRRLAENDICFIGPPSSAMFSLGDKIASTIIAQTLDIPTIEWSGNGLKLDLNVIEGEVSVGQQLFNLATVSDLNEGLRSLEINKIGYPLMIKASEGGGGKGIRKCKNEADFRENFIQVQAEVPGSPIFLMKCVENARHIEVQLIADRYGCVIPVYTRDCSIQRRCQKIIEEAPASIAPQEILRRMQEDAVKIAKLVGYESAGTVEYMYLPEEEKYFFLELNPRLQVEHPCTEMIASINIPAIQIQIAMGLPLNRIADIRLFYGFKDEQLYEDTPLPDDLVRTVVDRHCIAARITSEDPKDFFRPSTGSVETLNFRSARDVWGYFSISSSGKVHEYADSQFGHLFAVGRTRHEAVSKMLVALKELEVRATFAMQVAYLVDLLKEPDFTNNKFNTQWLDNRIASNITMKETLPISEIIAISSAVIGHAKITSTFNNFKNAVERGQVLPTKDLTETILFDLVKDMNIYQVSVSRCGPINYFISLNGGKTEVNIHLLGDGRTIVQHNKTSYMCNFEETSDKYKVYIGLSLIVFEKDNDPSILKSPYTGKFLGYKKANGDYLSLGTQYAQVESMKLVFNVEVKKAPGRLEYVAKEGDLLYPGSIIARLTDQKDSEKYKPKPFLEVFPDWESPSDVDDNISECKQYTQCYDTCNNVLNGSVPPSDIYNPKTLVEQLFTLLESRTLPTAQVKAAMSKILNRLPRHIAKEIESLADGPSNKKFGDIKRVLETYFSKLTPLEWETSKLVCANLYETCERYESGVLHNMAYVLNELLENYKECERFFEGRQYDDAVVLLNQQFGNQKDKVVQMIYAHTQLRRRNELVLTILKHVENRGMHLVTFLTERLRDIGNMFHLDSVSEYARHLLLKNNRTKYRKFLNKVIWDINHVPIKVRENEEVLVVEKAVDVLREKFLELQKLGISPKEVLEKSPWMHKVLHEFFFDNELADYVIRTYIQRYSSVTTIQRAELVDFGKIFEFHGKNSAGSDQHYAILTLNVTKDNFENALGHQKLISSLKYRFANEQVRLAIFVNVARNFQQNLGTDESREAQLEELPFYNEVDDSIIAIAENSAKNIQTQLPNLTAHVIACCRYKPVMQIDVIGAERLELWRLPKSVKTESDRMSNLRVYKYDDESEKRFSKLFVREIVEVPIRLEECENDVTDVLVDYIDNACGAINVAMRKFNKLLFVSNHIFLYVAFPKLPETYTVDYELSLEEAYINAVRSQKDILFKHRVTEVEIVTPQLRNGGHVKHRVKFLDETGVTPEFGIYHEKQLKIEPQRLSHKLYNANLGSYESIKRIEKKRVSTRANGTTYVYDYPTLFGRACLEQWRNLKASSEQSQDVNDRRVFNDHDYRKFFDEEELIVKDGELHHIVDKEELKVRADNCNNESGMVAWLLTLYTPEQPRGYKVVAIANDITFQSGSFAIPEDEVYSLASQYSRKHKLPRLNVSCNSGARIGLAEDISKTFRVKFKDPANPSEGFDYLYVEDSDEHPLKDQIVHEKMPNGLLRIKSVVGRSTEHIGVENLQGSGLIAGETSKSYEEVPTYCFVTGRSVGIGAYTARLAHRIVQSRTSHIILTGAPALNTLLGKEVYTSNNQLGGVQIMHKNGVTHAVVDDDFEGVCKLVKWMSYLPVKKEPFPFYRSFGVDSDYRDVVFDADSNKNFDIRHLIDSGDSTIQKGICDSGSFDEIMEEWAKTIIAGRARIGGVPIGVVSSELRNVKNVIPADPACPNSQEIEFHQAGQVWYPDSAFKTAEVIGDFNRENLPLLFIASLRGFSGGQKDMFDMVLKFGAQIVDALRQYKQPVIVYIPCNGELRGGAWAVLDSQINPGFIHMVADKKSRGGILEPNAIVGIKFRKEKLFALQKRNDEIMMHLDSQLSEEIRNNGAESPEAVRLDGLLKKRAHDLGKIYRNISVEFADLHDRCERMHIKNAVQHVTELKNARNMFINLFKLEMAKTRLVERYIEVSPDVTRNDAYTWLSNELEQYKSGSTSLTLKQQLEVVEKYISDSSFCHEIDTIRELSIERMIAQLPLESRDRLLRRFSK